MEIVFAQYSHILQIIELWKEVMDFHQNIDAYWSRREDGHIKYEELLRESLKSEDAIVLVAVENMRIVGYSRSWISKSPPTLKQGSYGFISDMAVTPEYRRMGTGKLLLDRTLEWFFSRNINRIELAVAAENQIGYSFWKKQGFQDYSHRLYLEKYNQR